MMKNIDFFNIFPLPVQLIDYNLQLLFIMMTELFVPIVAFIELKLKTKPIGNLKVTVTVFIKPIVGIHMK